MNWRDWMLILILGIMIALFVHAFMGCTIEVRPLGYKPPVKKVATKKHTTHHRRAASQDTMYVSPGWLQEYHEMEAEHGGYSIADDRKIQQDGDKVRVPRTVLKHFHDLSRTPKTEATSDTPP